VVAHPEGVGEVLGGDVAVDQQWAAAAESLRQVQGPGADGMQMQDIERFAGVGRDLNPGAFEGLDLIFVRAADSPAPLRRVAVFQVDADLNGSPPTDTICLASGRFL